METLICETCAAPIPYSGVDRRFQLATCGHCSSIFDISSEVETTPLFHDPPDGLRIDKQDSLWRASWSHNGEAFMLLIAAIGMLVAGLVMMSTSNHASMLVIAALAFVALAHREISMTSVELTRSNLVFESRAGFWGTRYRQDLEVSIIEQIFVAEKGPSRFELHVVTTDNQHENIAAEAVGGDLTMPVAFYLEQEIERNLGLRDRPVGGESVIKQVLLKA